MGLGRSHIGKRKYTNDSAAAQVIRNMRKRGGRFGEFLQSYKCVMCQYYHIGRGI